MLLDTFWSRQVTEAWKKTQPQRAVLRRKLRIRRCLSRSCWENYFHGHVLGKVEEVKRTVHPKIKIQSLFTQAQCWRRVVTMGVATVKISTKKIMSFLLGSWDLGTPVCSHLFFLNCFLSPQLLQLLKESWLQDTYSGQNKKSYLPHVSVQPLNRHSDN